MSEVPLQGWGATVWRRSTARDAEVMFESSILRQRVRLKVSGFRVAVSEFRASIQDFRNVHVRELTPASGRGVEGLGSILIQGFG